MMKYSNFHIHGDNIVECERTFELIRAALADLYYSVSGPSGSPVCPQYQLHLRNSQETLYFTYYPGYGRWNDDIIQSVRNRGGILREAADAIVTGVAEKSEQILIAIEYCGALPAGNQAWQRNGRAYSYGLARIPYLYVAELGGFELNSSSRERKAPRMPNPAVPFSYLSFSFGQGTCVLPIFVTSPGADDTSRKTHAAEFADGELIALIRAVFLDEDSSGIQELLRQKVLALVRKRALSSRVKNTLTAAQWSKAYSVIKQGGSLVSYLVNESPLPWAKTAYISDLTETAKALMEIASKFAIGLTSSVLPMCIIPAQNRRAFASEVSILYNSDLPPDFVEWINREEHLTICWVMGFKPHGDDARPDRGLPPLARMLIGNECDLLSVVYGPAPTATWQLLCDEPIELARRNGLWESILSVSDGLLVDSATDNVTNHGFSKSHWEAVSSTPTQYDLHVAPLPIRVGEHDVDTVLHTLFARHDGIDAYEGMCNPPGGDWSGISLLSADRSLELRWLSLPRVSGVDTKRPDHVFQLFGLTPRPIIFSIESKETAQSVEKNIGTRLSKYITNLIESPASIERVDPAKSWRHSTHQIDPGNFIFASGAAFISDVESQIESVIEKAEADVVIAFSFQDNGKTCRIRFIPGGEIGRVICNYLARVGVTRSGIKVFVG